MNERWSRQEEDLYRRCDEVLHYIWDPIGVAGYPATRDEYDSYVPQVFQLVKAQADAQEIAAHLANIADKSMGCGMKPERARYVAELLLEWREWIYKEGDYAGTRAPNKGSAADARKDARR